MNPTREAACRDVLDRLRAQIQNHLPPVTSGYTTTACEAVPFERLPAIADCVRQYVEGEAVLAGSAPPTEGDPATS